MNRQLGEQMKECHDKFIKRVLKIKREKESEYKLYKKTYLFHACLRFLELYRVKRSEMKKKNDKQSLFQKSILPVC